MPDQHIACRRCAATKPEAFDTPTGAYCRECWAYITDHGRRFGEWIEEQLRPAPAFFSLTGRRRGTS
jgi:hypothetical protein